MSRDADQLPAACLEPAVELEREEQVRELGLRISSPARVPLFALKVVEPHLPRFVVIAAYSHNASAGLVI